jgi:ornithine cyclodeaminase/alanine dehydrogenase-like protein (mu-crystallin family)
MSHQLGREVSTAAEPQEAVDGADILIAATNSNKPVINGSWLTPGMHVTSIANGDKTRTRQEIDEETLRRADPIFVTSKETVCVNESDVFRAVRDQIISWERVHEISSLLLGETPGRTNDRQITLFKLQGTGIMDVAIGLRAYERIKGGNLALRL